MSWRHRKGELTFDVNFRMFHIVGVGSEEEMKGWTRKRVTPWCHHESTDGSRLVVWQGMVRESQQSCTSYMEFICDFCDSFLARLGEPFFFLFFLGD